MQTINTNKLKRCGTLLALVLLLHMGKLLAQPHTLTLQDVEIRSLIETMSEISGKNFVVDPRVSGKVTLISARPMETDELYQVFLGVLAVHGFAAIESGPITKIIPAADAGKQGLVESDSLAAPDAMLTQVIPLQHIAATEAQSLIRPLLNPSATLTVHGGSNSLVLTERQGNIERLKRIIHRIDTESDDDIEMIPLQHANASDMSRTLGNFLKADASGQGIRMMADERTNTILLSGPKAQRMKLRATIAHLDTPLDQGGTTQVMYLNYARASELVGVLKGISTDMENPTPENTAAGETSIYAHEGTNALVITASPPVLRSLANVVRQLDIPRAQVLVEAVIAEISTHMAQELGVQWQSSSDFENEGVIGGTNFGTTGNIIGSSINPFNVGQGLNLGYLNGTVTLPGSDTPILQLGALVSALGSDTDSNILSTPSIVTLDNEEAKIQVGQEVPFLTGQYTNTGANESSVNPFQTIQREDVGLTLTVVPHINEGDAVILEISQEISSLQPSAGAVDLITDKRTLKTTVQVPDNGVLVLGGLISEDLQEKISKVPLLGDIPLLGKLFRHRSSKKVQRNLMVFLRPTILKNAQIMQSVTNGKYSALREQQLQKQQNPGASFKPEMYPVLPALDGHENNEQ